MNRRNLAMFLFRLILAGGVLLARAGTQSAQTRQQGKPNQNVVYTCPMDPDVKSEAPGECPKCGMALSAAGPGAGAPTAAPPSALEGRVDNLRIPDTTVLDQDGRKLRFYSDLVKGRAVAINFIFTTCTTICPPLTATFRAIQQRLERRVGQDIALISVSVDPAVDIPERLKSFAAKFHAGAGWTFVTGSQAEIDGLLAALGAAVSDKNSHTPMVLIGNDQARFWTRANGLASPDKLTKIISDVASRSAGARK